MSECIVILITFSAEKDAQTIIKELLNKKLIACANILSPIQSHYEWKGKLVIETEVLTLLKTRRDLFPEVVHNVRSHHSYEVPEIIAIPILDGSKEYLDWIIQETTHAKSKG